MVKVPTVQTVSSLDGQLVSSLIVEYKKGVSPIDKNGKPTCASSVSIIRYTDLTAGPALGLGMYVVNLGTAVKASTAQMAADQIKTCSSVASATPNNRVTLSPIPTQPAPKPSPTPSAPASSPSDLVSSLIVEYKKGVSPIDKNGKPTCASSVSIIRYTDLTAGPALGLGMYVVNLGTAVKASTAQMAADQIKTCSSVASATPNYRVTLTDPVPTPTVSPVVETTNSIIVKYRAGVTQYVGKSLIPTCASSIKAVPSGQVTAGTPLGLRMYTLNLGAQVPLKTAVLAATEIAKCPSVEFAEVNRKVSVRSS